MQKDIQHIVEAIIFSSNSPMTVAQIATLLVDEDERTKVSNDEIRKAILDIQSAYEGRGIELKEVASGFRFQVPQGFEPWVSKLFEERPPRYSRALLETLAIITYRQPITRAEIEDIRGVAVGSNIIKTLQEREWVQILGHKDTPGRPAMFGTTKTLLDYFNLKSLDELPSLAELKDIESLDPQLQLDGEAIKTHQAMSEEAGVMSDQADESGLDNGEAKPKTNETDEGS